MERKYYKAINFDLDTNKLKLYYPHYQQAYYDLMSFFGKNGFSHRQGSGYVSDRKITSVDIIDLIGNLRRSYDWISTCVKKIDVTNIGSQYDLTYILAPDDTGEDGDFDI